MTSLDSLGAAARRQEQEQIIAEDARRKAVAAPVAASNPRKYRNAPCVICGHKFDSKAEGREYVRLAYEASEGIITNLKLQPEYVFRIGGMVVCKYRADFEYKRNGVVEVIDVKSPATAKNRAYRIKNKLMRALFGIAIVEVMA
jgi:hypothetical protein